MIYSALYSVLDVNARNTRIIAKWNHRIVLVLCGDRRWPPAVLEKWSVLPEALGHATLGLILSSLHLQSNEKGATEICCALKETMVLPGLTKVGPSRCSTHTLMRSKVVL